jgi:hypothetical protein
LVVVRTGSTQSYSLSSSSSSSSSLSSLPNGPRTTEKNNNQNQQRKKTKALRLLHRANGFWGLAWLAAVYVRGGRRDGRLVVAVIKRRKKKSHVKSIVDDFFAIDGNASERGRRGRCPWYAVNNTGLMLPCSTRRITHVMFSHQKRVPLLTRVLLVACSSQSTAPPRSFLLIPATLLTLESFSLPANGNLAAGTCVGTGTVCTGCGGSFVAILSFLLADCRRSSATFVGPSRIFSRIPAHYYASSSKFAW